jgi:hypothetical protein
MAFNLILTKKNEGELYNSIKGLHCNKNSSKQHIFTSKAYGNEIQLAQGEVAI